MYSEERTIRGVIFSRDTPTIDNLTADIEWNLELIQIENGNESGFEEVYRKVQECLNYRVGPEKKCFNRSTIS